MTREAEILKVLKPYAAAFPNMKMQPEAWPIYASVLSVLTPDEVNAAMRKLLHTIKFFPTVAEIFEAAQSIRETAEASGLPTAGEAWQEVIRQARQNGLERPWTFSCPEVKKALDQFGKVELMMVEEKQTNTARAHFMRIYTDVIKRAKEERENKAVLNALPKVRGKIVQIAEARGA
jgi:hypothetical protein